MRYVSPQKLTEIEFGCSLANQFFYGAGHADNAFVPAFTKTPLNVTEEEFPDQDETLAADGAPVRNENEDASMLELQFDDLILEGGADRVASQGSTAVKQPTTALSEQAQVLPTPTPQRPLSEVLHKPDEPMPKTPSEPKMNQTNHATPSKPVDRKLLIQEYEQKYQSGTEKEIINLIVVGERNTYYF
ncbi:unnamed protein product [Dibothriocephalus latus]|uniref:Uncharacterized protein n=1 Tax=Dibothriocephalus latus TaxID=60516 RepID=A0A3P7PEB2_DIBLA|nr:unnamed protein product [Dibothriocephalus latus]